MVPTSNLAYVFLRVDSTDSAGQTRRAQLIERLDASLVLKSKVAIEPGTGLLLWGKALSEPVGSDEKLRHVVTRCESLSAAGYRIYCAEPDVASEASAHASGSTNAAETDHGDIDYYEVLQISPHADTETIHRVYRYMAQRYHPDNKENGDAVRFGEILEAYRLLSDPERRTAYDVSRKSSLESLQDALVLHVPDNGPADEPAKRQAILKLFYYKMLRSPAHPGTMVRELEELLQIPDAHLQFSLWYLRQKNWIIDTGSGRLAITIDGVEEVERLGILDEVDDRKQLEAPHAEEPA